MCLNLPTPNQTHRLSDYHELQIWFPRKLSLSFFSPSFPFFSVLLPPPFVVFKRISPQPLLPWFVTPYPILSQFLPKTRLTFSRRRFQNFRPNHHLPTHANITQQLMDVKQVIADTA